MFLTIKIVIPISITIKVFFFIKFKLLSNFSKINDNGINSKTAISE